MHPKNVAKCVRWKNICNFQILRCVQRGIKKEKVDTFETVISILEEKGEMTKHIIKYKEMVAMGKRT